MTVQSEYIRTHTSLGLDLGDTSQAVEICVRFFNGTHMPIWFPIEPEPAYRPDYDARIVLIWFGYFDELYLQYRERYMIPPMAMVSPDESIRVPIKAQALVDILVKQRFTPRLFVNVATTKITPSRTRGAQPLDDYLANSCVLVGTLLNNPNATTSD